MTKQIQIFNVSPDLKGPNWYRINPYIGTKIATSLTKPRYCETIASGWILGPSALVKQYRVFSPLIMVANILGK